MSARLLTLGGSRLHRVAVTESGEHLTRCGLVVAERRAYLVPEGDPLRARLGDCRSCDRSLGSSDASPVRLPLPGPWSAAPAVSVHEASGAPCAVGGRGIPCSTEPAVPRRTTPAARQGAAGRWGLP